MNIEVLRDLGYLGLAIDEALKGITLLGLSYGGQVGAVLVDSNGQTLAQAHNAPIGGIRMHAEEIVLSQVLGSDLSDATLYLTSEPCNGNPYHERMHCCEQIEAAGIGRVVIGTRKWVFQGGEEYLAERGVVVELVENTRLERLCDSLAQVSVNQQPGHRGMGTGNYQKALELRSTFTIF